MDYSLGNSIADLAKINSTLYESLENPEAPRKIGEHQVNIVLPDSEKLVYGTVICDYAAKDPGELSLEEMDVIGIYPDKTKNGRMYGISNGTKGWFPESVIKLLSEEETIEEEIRNKNAMDLSPTSATAEAPQDASSGSQVRNWYNKYIRMSSENGKLADKISEKLAVEKPPQKQDTRSKSSGTLTPPASAKLATTPKLGNLPRGPGQRILWVDFMGGPDEVAKLGMTKNEIKRQEVIFEIITTEADYIQDLETLCELYIRPLQKSKLIRPKDMSIIFSNIEQVLPVNQELFRSLEKRQADNPVINLVGEIFIRVEFGSGQLFVNRANSRLKPIQRVCKYPLLVRELIRATDPSHPDMENLNKALLKIETVVTTINEGARHTENVHKMIELQTKFLTKVSLVAPSRSLVKSRSIDAYNANGDRKKREVYLFNDMLVIAKPDGDKYKLLNMVAFDVLSVNLIDAAEDAENFYIEVHHQGHSKIILIFDSYNSRETWMKTIESTLNEYKAQKNRINQANIKALSQTDLNSTCEKEVRESTTTEKQKSLADLSHSPGGLYSKRGSVQELVELRNEGARPQSAIGPTVAPKPLTAAKLKPFSNSQEFRSTESAPGTRPATSYGESGEPKKILVPKHIQNTPPDATHAAPILSHVTAEIKAMQIEADSIKKPEMKKSDILPPSLVHSRASSNIAVDRNKKNPTTVNRPVKKATVLEVLKTNGAHQYTYKIQITYISQGDPTIVYHTFDDFFDLHLQLIGHFPDAAGIKTSDNAVSQRILPELPAQMMFVSEAVAQARILQLQVYIDIKIFCTPMELFEACKNGDAATLARLISSRSKKKYRRNLDIFAVVLTYSAFVLSISLVANLIVLAGLSGLYYYFNQSIVNKPSPTGDTLLHFACSRGHLACCKLLVERGAKLDVVSKSGFSPLALAITTQNNIEIIEYLIDQGSNVNFQCMGLSPLAIAVLSKKPALTDLILGKGGDIDATNTDGYSILHFAIIRENYDLALYLISKGADIHTCNRYGTWAMDDVLTDKLELIDEAVAKQKLKKRQCQELALARHTVQLLSIPPELRILVLENMCSELDREETEAVIKSMGKPLDIQRKFTTAEFLRSLASK
ncbi:Rho guanine nucleotide exchange factor 4 [Terramyces sp. JEL0728]|nr:Rho guanine nucleotide exchange factor 4 [Terramyces sp. JEL0728]